MNTTQAPNPTSRPIIRLPETKGAEVFHSFSKGLCPQCRRLVDGQRIIRNDKVYLRKQCPEHGRSEALISGDADWFLKSLAYIKPGSVPLKHSMPVTKGCPSDCGLCADHEQHSCLPIIEITNYCNLECPICIVQNRHNYNMTVPEFHSIIDGLIVKEGVLDTINLSGGEPTVHPQFLELLDLAKRPEISRVSISTNGVLIASDLDFCRELARRGTYVNLQLDALSNPELRRLRGAGDQEGLKRRALDNLRTAGVRTTIVSTLAKGVNDTQIGDCVKLLLDNDFILSLMFQPAAYTGYGGTHFAPHNPLDVITIPDVVRHCEEQTNGTLRRSDFHPLPCSHPSCFALTYLLKTDSGVVPFPRFIELEQYLEAIANRGTLRPDETLERSIRDTIDSLWSGSGQVPDCDAILQTLRRLLKLMYPSDRALELEEQLQIGESLVKTIFIHAFMDEHTFEVDRIKKCCTHYALPDGRLMPGCAYNMLYRHNDPRYTGPVGTTPIWGQTK